MMNMIYINKLSQFVSSHSVKMQSALGSLRSVVNITVANIGRNCYLSRHATLLRSRHFWGVGPLRDEINNQQKVFKKVKLI